MSATKNVITRYKILDDLLSDHYHDYSLNDLTREVSDRLHEFDSNTDGVVRRTIEKDIKYLEGFPFYVEINRYSTEYFNKEKQKQMIKQCLKYEDPSFSIFKKQLSSDEEYLLRETLNLLGQFDGLPNFSALEALRSSLGIKEHEKSIISFTKNPIQETSILGELFTAISQKQVIDILYHKFDEQEPPQTFRIHPYLLKEYNRRWFLFAAADKDQKLLCFGVERIQQVTPLPSLGYIEYEGNLDELFEDIIGVTFYTEEPTRIIEFWVSDFSKKYVLTKPLHESQKKVKAEKETTLRQQYPQLENGILLQIECKYNYELIRELTSYGKDLLVLGDHCLEKNTANAEDNYIKKKVALRIKEMYESYQSIYDFSELPNQ